MCQFHADDRVFDQILAKGSALVGIFDRFFVADSGEPQTLDDDADPFVVEICHDHLRGNSALHSETAGVEAYL